MAVDALTEMAEAIRKLGPEMAARVAKRAEVTLQAALEVTLAAGQTPEHTPWAPRKADGGRAYAHAASRIVTKSSGNLVRVTLSGPEVYGHFGGRGKEPRQMIPDAGGAIPESVAQALTKAASDEFEAVTK